MRWEALWFREQEQKRASAGGHPKLVWGAEMDFLLGELTDSLTVSRDFRDPFLGLTHFRATTAGDDFLCVQLSWPGLVSCPWWPVPILSGELYFLATSYPSAYTPHGSIYKFVDPSRWDLGYLFFSGDWNWSLSPWQVRKTVLTPQELPDMINEAYLSFRCKADWSGTSLVAQWLSLLAPNAGAPSSIPVQGTRCHMHAATKEPTCHS